MLVILLSMLLMADEALLSICWPHWTSRVTVLTRKVHTFPGSCCTTVTTAFSMLLMACWAWAIILLPHVSRLSRTIWKISAALSFSVASPSTIAVTIRGMASPSLDSSSGTAAVICPQRFFAHSRT